MANEEHLQTFKRGVGAWNLWRRANPHVEPDLTRADLRDWWDLAYSAEDATTNFDLSGATLEGANFTRADLGGTNFRNANLTSANFSGAYLEDVALNRANLELADLSSAHLDLADLSSCRMNQTRMGNVDLSGVLGLETILHSGPSTIGIDTIYRSKGNISEVFLRGAGVPENFITYMKSLTGSAFDYYSCFISYSSKDDAFAVELHAKLQAQHVRCWKDSEDLKIGDTFQEVIDSAIRLHDKLLLVLSENSMNSSWVEWEVRKALKKEKEKGLTVLFPVRLDDAVMEAPYDWAGEVRKRHIGDFRKWKEHDSFQKSLDRLLRDLKSQELKPK
jgi:hypothetical protein